MTAAEQKGPLLKEALNQPWPVPGSELFASGRGANRLDNPKLLWPLLQNGFSQQRLALDQPILPQLHRLDDSLSLSHKILNRLAFVDLYFDQLVQHSYLDREVLQLLYQLRPAILHAILHSDNLLANPRHPLRTVLEDVCSWGIGWDSHIGKAGEKYYAVLNNLVTIGNGLAEDCRELPDAYTTSRNVLTDLDTRYRQLEERVCENERANMENLAIRRQIEAVINEYVEGRPLPATVITFFHGPWRDMLHRLRVLNKTETAEWKEALQLMDQLVFCLSPQPSGRQEQVNLIPQLIPVLKRSTQKAGLDPSQAHLVDDIIELFKQILTGASVPMQNAPPLASLSISGVTTSVSSAIAQQVLALKPGQWVLCWEENNEIRRGRLARIFPEARQLLLVNLLGARPFSKSIEELGLALNTKRAHLLVDKNLSHIILSLTVDLYIRDYRKAVPAAPAAAPAKDDFRQQSAQKALAEAQKLREQKEKQGVVAATPLPDSESSRIEALVHDLKIGSRLQMKNRIGEIVTCKVAVVYASTGKMVITDTAGLRVGEYLRRELIELIMKGEASVVEVADSFEDSLSKVLKTLKKTS